MADRALEVLCKEQECSPNLPSLGAGAPPAKIGKKFEISKIEPSLAGSVGKVFRGFGSRLANILGGNTLSS